MADVDFDPESGAYRDCRVARGFPMGGIGAGGLGFNTDGRFEELRLTNNWMCPVHDVPGCLHALSVRRGDSRRTLLLRRAGPGREYEGVRNVRSTSFVGKLPAFRLEYGDDLPIRVALDGFTPHVPHDVVSSTLPVAVFRFTLENPTREAIEASVLFSFENVLGRGGTGHLGVILGPERELRGVRRRIVYDSVAGNFQEEIDVSGRRGVRFRSEQRWDPRSHRASVLGEYALLAEGGPGIDVTTCDGWDAGAARASLLDDFSCDGRLRSREPGRRGVDGGYRPAAAVAAATTLGPGSARELVFLLAWWTADHVTELALQHGAEATHDGIRVGHVYENHFASLDELATHALDRRRELETASTELGRTVEDSTLPRWLVRVLQNSIDSTLCNTIVPQSGRMYTLEGMDWHWPMGGLTGTNDQRLSAHPYTSVFFTELDLSELDEFRRLADARGAIPHGNGNCDLGLGRSDIPYGWPMLIKDFLPAKEWTDLTLSLVLQVGKLFRITGRREILGRFWPDLVRGMEYMASLAPNGVPEGGTTYDVWDFPGAFSYTATLYLAALELMGDLAERAEPARIPLYRERFQRCRARVDAELWDPRGFFRSTEKVDTIFSAALAGDWIARYAGLDPVVAPERAASHLRHQHRVLVEQAARDAAGRWRTKPRAEARFDGTPVRHALGANLPESEEFVYVWQVLSYQAMEQIYLGQVDAGLQTLRLVVDRLWHDGNAWNGGLRGDGESVYMTHPVVWAALNALTGAALDVERRTLYLSPRTGGEIGRLRCPFFFPPFWARLDYDPAAGAASVEVLRTFGEPIRIDRIVERPALGDPRVHEIAPTEIRSGARLHLRPRPG